MPTKYSLQFNTTQCPLNPVDNLTHYGVQAKCSLNCVTHYRVPDNPVYNLTYYRVPEKFSLQFDIL